MIVYVVLGNIPYEGNGEPEAVFTSKKKADLFVAEQNARPNFLGETYEAYEMEITK